MKIYVASSWRNEDQPAFVDLLREEGHEVYDFHHPEPGDNGFHWSEIHPEWESWTADQHTEALKDPLAVDGFAKDMAALDWAEVVILLLPSARSAHLELGYGVGKGKRTIILLPSGKQTPELMYRMADAICTSPIEVIAGLKAAEARGE